MQGRPGTPQLMRALNRATVIDLLARQGPLSQTQLCQTTQLSRATVSKLIAGLREEQLVVEVRKRESSGGRRQVSLRLNAEAGYVVGVDLGGTKMAGVVTDLGGHALAKLKRPTNAGQGLDAVTGSLFALIDQLIAAAGVPEERVRGLGVGVPGVVNSEGLVEWAPALEWRDFPLRRRLMERYPYPVFVENDVNLLALGEHWYGIGQGADSLVCLAVGTGLGAGIVLGGQLYTGVHKAAGEICNLVAERQSLGRRFSGFGCLESYASGAALARHYLEASDRADRAPGLDAEYVFERAREGDPKALSAIEEFTQHLALAVVSLVAVLDPDLIVLGGGVSQSADLFRDRLVALCAPVLHVMPPIEVSTLGVDAGVMGAVALTLHNTSENPLR